MNTRIFLSVIALCLLLAGCKEEKPKVMSLKMVEQTEAKDLTIYGICSEGSSMNVVELVTPRGDTLAYMKDQEALEDPVKGGLSVGDNLALMPEATQKLPAQIRALWSSL